MDYRNEFLRQTALFNAIGAAFQRASIYKEGTDVASKELLKRDLESHLRQIDSLYCSKVSSEKHLQTLIDVSDQMSASHARILKGRRFRVGIAQKAVNIYLKLIWCYGWIPEPPHCPIDSIVLATVGDTHTKWTKMDGIAAYRTAIESIREYIRQTDPKLSLANWELKVWNSRRERQGTGVTA